MVENRFENEIKKILAHPELNTQQIKTLKEYKEYLESRGVKLSTIRNYLKGLCWLGKTIKKPYKKTTEKDLIKYFASIKDKKGISHANKIIVRVFYKWLEQPEKINWIKIERPNYDSIDPKTVLTATDVKNLADNTNCLRDRVLILIFWDSGARLSEVLNTKIKDYTPNQYGVNLFIPISKTRKRNIQLMESAPDVVAYLNQHPLRKNPDAPFFYKDRPFGEALGFQGVRKMLRLLKNKVKLNKKCNPHWFRHSRLSLEAKDLTDPYLKQFAGWSKTSTMASRYIHLSDDDVTKKRLVSKGLLDANEKEAKDSSLDIKKCFRCGMPNSALNKQCSHCWIPLNRKAYHELLKTEQKVIAKSIETQQPINKEFVKGIIKEMIRDGELQY